MAMDIIRGLAIIAIAILAYQILYQTYLIVRAKIESDILYDEIVTELEHHQ